MALDSESFDILLATVEREKKLLARMNLLAKPS